MRVVTISTAVILALGASIISGCASVQGDWEEVSQKNTVFEYERFLATHPRSEFSTQARDRIEGIKFNEAKERSQRQRDPYPMTFFLRQYPNGRFSAEARELEAKPAYENARRKNTPAAYAEFLKEYPTNSLVPEAQASLRALKFKAVQERKSLKAYEDFIALYPSGPDSSQLVSQLPEMRKWEPSRLLAEALISMSPKGVMPVSSSGPAGAVRLQRSSTETRDLEQLQSLLRAGADPNLVRIRGYEAPGKERQIPLTTFVSVSLGEPGFPVHASEGGGGMSLLEYCVANNLPAAQALLRTFGAK